MYELIKEVKAGAPKECLLNKYCITYRMYNRMVDNEPEVIVKVKSYTNSRRRSCQKQVPILIYCIFLVRFPQRQGSYDVTDIVSYIVAVFLANIDQQ